MIVVLVAAAAASVVGAILALTARDARMALGWLGVTLVASGLVDDPLPALIPFAARLVGALLAIEILRIAVRVADGTAAVTRSHRSDPALLALVGAAGVVAGILAESSRIAAGADLPELSPIVLGAAFGLVAVGLTPLILARDVFQLGIGATLVFLGAAIGRSAAAPGPTALEGLIVTGAVVALSAAVAGVLVAAAARERSQVLIERPALPLPKTRPAAARQAGAIFGGSDTAIGDLAAEPAVSPAIARGQTGELEVVPATAPLVAKRRRAPADTPGDLPAPRPPRTPRTPRTKPAIDPDPPEAVE